MNAIKRKVYTIMTSVLLLPLYMDAQNPPVEQPPNVRVQAKKFFNQLSGSEGRYTQSEAHLSIEPVKDRVRYIPNLFNSENQTIIHKAISREREYNEHYYVFYHAAPVAHLYQDVMRELYKSRLGPVGALKEDAFQFLRYSYKDPTYNQYKDVADFLIKEVKHRGVINDREGGLGRIILSTNFALLGNTGFTGESTWLFFNEPQPWAGVNKQWLEDCIKSFNYPVNFIDELLVLHEDLKDKAGNLGSELLQIFIPKNLIDQVGYLCWRIGMPFDKEFLMKMFERSNMSFGRSDGITFTQLMDVVNTWRTLWNRRDAKVLDAINKFIVNVQKNTFGLSAFLDQYKKNPDNQEVYNYLQARLLVTNNWLLNPASGIKIYRYNKLPAEQLAQYEEKLNNIILRIISSPAK